MPRNPRRYDLERKYDGTPKRKAENASRKRAVTAAKKAGKVAKKGQHIDHKDGNPKNNSPKNLRVLSAKKNTSYPRTATARKASTVTQRKGKR